VGAHARAICEIKEGMNMAEPLKTCPQCGRGYDLTMSFCLDDGQELLYGPAVSISDGGEAKTAILPGLAASTAANDAATVAMTVATSPLTELQNSIAVLPFVNMSSDIENEYFCHGLAEELLNALSKLGDLKVAARTSAFSFQGKDEGVRSIGKKLGVQHVLEGSVRRSGDQVRISVQLVNAQDGYQLWSERYDREIKDIFQVQDEITMAVVDALKIRLKGGERSGLFKRYEAGMDAYEYLLKGNYYLAKRNLVDTPEINIAVEMYKKAVEIDPKYALAHARLGYSCMWKAVYNDPEDPRWITLAQRHLDIAESIDPELPQIFEARAEISWSKYRNFDIPAAVHGICSVRRTYPHAGTFQMGIFAFHSGIEAVAAKELSDGHELDPSDDFLKIARVDAYSLFGRFDEAIEIGKPYGASANGYIRALLGVGRIAEAQQALDEALATAPNNPRRLGEKVLLLAHLGKSAEAVDLIPQIRKKITISQAYHHATYDFAGACALNGDAEKSVKWLGETFDTGMPIYPAFERDPNLDPIRKTPEFTDFMRTVKPKWENLKRVFDDLRENCGRNP
jgi:serine/threonine-protein kinase